MVFDRDRALWRSPQPGEGQVQQPRIDARGWIGIAVFILTIMVLWMIAKIPELRKDDFFKVLATAIVLTGFIQGVVGWAYTATKQGGELAQKAADIVQQSATANADATANGSAGAAAGDSEEAVRSAINDAIENGALTGERTDETEPLT